MWRIVEGFFDSGGESALASAVRDVEARSSAEVVVAVRRSSGSYRDASLLIGAVGSVATLAFGLFSPWPFSLHWLLLDPILCGIAIAWGARYVPAIRRWVTPKRERIRRVEVHARALFLERGVAATTGRTGVLIYVSLLERAACVVPDVGLTSKIPAEEWRAAVRHIEAAAHRSKATAVARAILALAPMLSAHLPCSADDVNELPDEVSVS
jgi:putative membrane protein